MNEYNSNIVYRDHQTTPMMNGNGENNSDQHGYTNGHQTKKVFKNYMKRINKYI
jgi:hypothetical protein